MEINKETVVEYIKGLYKFEGRRGRKSYALSTLAIIGAVLITIMIGSVLTLISNTLWLAFMVPCLLAAIVGTYTTAAQRFRDFGQSGCWAFVFLIPYVGFAVAIALYFIPPNPGENKYGPQL